MPSPARAALYVSTHLILKQLYEVGFLDPFADKKTEPQRGRVTRSDVLQE